MRDVAYADLNGDYGDQGELARSPNQNPFLKYGQHASANNDDGHQEGGGDSDLSCQLGKDVIEVVELRQDDQYQIDGEVLDHEQADHDAAGNGGDCQSK